MSMRLSICVAAIAAFSAIFPPTASAGASVPVHASEAYGRVKLHFEPNRGQARNDTRFLARGPGYGLHLTSEGAELALAGTNAAMVRMAVVNADPNALVSGLEELPGKANYLIGADPAKWRLNIPTYAKVHYRGVYPGIDLVFYGNQGELEYDFVVHPGADPDGIALSFHGTDGIEIDGMGDLLLRLGSGMVRLRKPVAYQEVNGERQNVAVGYVLHDDHQVGFQVAVYDPRRPLVIDPVLVYSTYLGGGASEEVRAIKVDAAGSAYITGNTLSLNFPTTPGSFQTSFRTGSTPEDNADAFVTKLDPAGTGLVYSTYLGGSSFERAHDIALDAGGNAYVTGITASVDFPTTPGAFQPTFGSAFVTKLGADGSSLVYSTYLGDVGAVGNGIAVDAAGSAYVAGSGSIPTTPGAFDTTTNGGVDGFVTKLNGSGTGLVYSTYLGGSRDDSITGIAVDGAGNAYVVGTTNSTNFPTTAMAWQPLNAGSADAFIAKVNATGSALEYSTYLGGSAGDQTGRIALDSAGNAYVIGVTPSIDFPTTLGAFQQSYAGGFYDAFVVKLNSSGTTLLYSTYLGGLGRDEGNAIAVDAFGQAHVTGQTDSEDFPTFAALQRARAGAEDAFVTKLDAAGSVPIYSTYVGGTAFDRGLGIALDVLPSPNVYVTGQTASANFPVAEGFRTVPAGNIDAFVSKIGDPPRLANISTRMAVLTGDDVLIGGFIIGGSSPKTVVVRARGPSLAAAGVPNVLVNPVLNLYSGQTLIASNDDWQTAANAFTLASTGFAPPDSREPAIYARLNPGAYTAIVLGAGGTTGVGIVEVFQADALATSLINISTRGAVLTGDNVMIGGFIIQGSGPQTVVVRARGPSLSAAGVPNVLVNPVMSLFSGQTVIASNDDWQTASNAATLSSSGFAPSDPRESAIYITLNPGAYTAIVQGVGGTTGVGIVEVFAVP